MSKFLFLIFTFVASAGWAGETLIQLRQGDIPGRTVSYLGYDFKAHSGKFVDGKCARSKEKEQPSVVKNNKKIYTCEVLFRLKVKIEVETTDGVRFELKDSFSDKEWNTWFLGRDRIEEGQPVVTPKLEANVKSIYNALLMETLLELAEIDLGEPYYPYGSECRLKQLNILLDSNTNKVLRDSITNYKCPRVPEPSR